ncbi:MAG: hypothetical protein LBH06_03345 [Rikenellaceae bacterium]|nr:hypothetical protein [Rikenellaceae bacterium]
MNDRLKAVAIMSVSTDAGSTEIAIPLKLAKKAEPGGFVGWLCRMAPYLGRGAGDMRLANGVWRLDEKTRLPEHATLTTADRVQASTIDNLSSRGYLTGEYKKTGVKKIYAACWRAQNNLHL